MMYLMTYRDDVSQWHIKWHITWHIRSGIVNPGKSYTVHHDIYLLSSWYITWRLQWRMHMIPCKDICHDIYFTLFSIPVNPTQVYWILHYHHDIYWVFTWHIAMTYLMTYVTMTYHHDIYMIRFRYVMLYKAICQDSVEWWKVSCDMSCGVPVMVIHHVIRHVICQGDTYMWNFYLPMRLLE